MPIAAIHRSDDAPSGENLEYEKVFTDLLLAAQPEEERQAGNEIIAAQEPDAKAIVEKAEAVLDLSNDLRAAILYGYAQLRLVGLPGLAETTGFLRTALEEFWDSCHPQLDAEDDDDPTMRVNSMLGLVDTATTLRALRHAPLTLSPAFGRMSLRDIAIADGEVSPPADMENPPSAQTVSAAFQDTDDAVLKANLDAAQAALADVEAINAVFDERLPGQGPNLRPMQVMLKKAVSILAPVVGAPEEPSEAGDEGPATPAESQADAPRPAAPPPGTISSPADVEKALGRIIDYYAKHEPSSPLPILLERARRLVGADFLTIIQDLAPLGLENVQLIGGMENPE
ncbi:type VI secretion system protein TssA [Oceaniglobus trochenteri]|uniref:type VI secretion system protein TssA n=1 Tax=Oceaniglobus trochenteri TaxID=2763260 RepID=UPI001CFF8D24|nr:type VI secretion system protein TssA [Oceaniglobus trochenteri]